MKLKREHYYYKNQPLHLHHINSKNIMLLANIAQWKKLLRSGYILPDNFNRCWILSKLNLELSHHFLLTMQGHQATESIKTSSRNVHIQ
jgi:hypothetical protein